MMAKQNPSVFDDDILEYADCKRKWEVTVHASRPKEYNEVQQIIENIPHLYRPYVKSYNKLTDVWIELDKLFDDPSQQYGALLDPGLG